MDIAKQHWTILQKLDNEFATKVQSFLVTSQNGSGLFVVTNDGQGYWFGELNFGVDENAKKITANEPTLLTISDVVSMAQGNRHVVLLNNRGEIFALDNKQLGQIAFSIKNKSQIYFSSLATIVRPSDVQSFNSKFVSVRCGGEHSLALAEDGKVWAWGSNNSGQIFNSILPLTSPFVSLILQLVPHRVVAVECGHGYSLALTDRGEVYSWGANESGQLGHTKGEFSYPGLKWCSYTCTKISFSVPVKSMAAGYQHTLLLTKDGEVFSCGQNGSGQLGRRTALRYSARLVKVAGLPFISQIGSHYSSKLSIAMTPDRTYYVWGRLGNEKLSDVPIKLPPNYRIFDSVLALYDHNTGISVNIEDYDTSRVDRMSSMFDNPENSDVKFLVEEKTINAHRNILGKSSDYFHRMFTETWPVDPDDPILKVTIPDHSYATFYAYLQFLYIKSCPTEPSILVELFELASQYFESDLQQSCILSMGTTLNPDSFCLYYPFVHRHSLPQISTFKQELVQFAATNMAEIVHIEAYKSMEAELCDNLTISIANLEQNNNNQQIETPIETSEQFIRKTVNEMMHALQISPELFNYEAD